MTLIKGGEYEEGLDTGLIWWIGEGCCVFMKTHLYVLCYKGVGTVTVEAFA